MQKLKKGKELELCYMNVSDILEQSCCIIVILDT